MKIFIILRQTPQLSTYLVSSEDEYCVLCLDRSEQLCWAGRREFSAASPEYKKYRHIGPRHPHHQPAAAAASHTGTPVRRQRRDNSQVGPRLQLHKYCESSSVEVLCIMSMHVGY